MKSILSLLAVCCCVVVLSGCKGDQSMVAPGAVSSGDACCTEGDCSSSEAVCPVTGASASMGAVTEKSCCTESK